VAAEARVEQLSKELAVARPQLEEREQQVVEAAAEPDLARPRESVALALPTCRAWLPSLVVQASVDGRPLGLDSRAAALRGRPVSLPGPSTWLRSWEEAPGLEPRQLLAFRVRRAVLPA
jgi:hypothetical protein